MILMELLGARKSAKKMMEAEKEKDKNSFKVKLWDGLQLAYKVTANSLYGQCGAKTSPISKVEHRPRLHHGGGSADDCVQQTIH